MTTTAQKLRETTYGKESPKVDEEKGIIYGVRCLGSESANGRIYTKQALEQASKLYEGKDVNLDHAAEAGADRLMLEGFGVLRNSRIESDGAVYADLHYLKSHHAAATVVERVQKIPENFGMSHDAVGEMSESVDGPDIVESLVEVNSVDLVRRPATNKSLFESTGNNMATKPKKRTVRQILEANKADKRAACLLELDEFDTMSEAPVEVAVDATPEDQIKAAFRSMIMAAFDDETLDMAATIIKMKDILKAQDKLSDPGAGEETPPAATEENTGHRDEDKPALESIRQELSVITRRNLVADVLESAGLHRSDLATLQLKLIEKQANKEEMQEIIESLEIKPVRRAAKPMIGSVLSESRNVGQSKSYDELIEGRKSNRRTRRA